MHELCVSIQCVCIVYCEKFQCAKNRTVLQLRLVKVLFLCYVAYVECLVCSESVAHSSCN